MSIFVFVLLSSVYAWDYASTKMTEKEERIDLEILARDAITALILTPGIPSNWSSINDENFNRTFVLALGLAENITLSGKDSATRAATAGSTHRGSRILDPSKVARLVELNNDTYYPLFKELLGIRGSGYEFGLNINVWNGTGYGPRYAIGREPFDDASNIVGIYRYGLLDGDWVQLRMQAWQRCRRAC